MPKKQKNHLKIASADYQHAIEIAQKSLRIIEELREIIRQQRFEIDEGKEIIKSFLSWFDEFDAVLARRKEFQPLQRQAIEWLAIRNRQREAARKERPDGLQTTIVNILKNNPKLKTSEVLEELRRISGNGVIENVNDAEGVIEWHDEQEQAGNTAISAIKFRVTRARKKLKLR